MLKLGWAVAASTFFLATTSAHAIDVGVVSFGGTASNDLRAYGAPPDPAPVGNAAGNYDNDNAGGNYSSYVKMTPPNDPDLISWKSDNAVARDASFTSSSDVHVVFNNDNANITPHLISEIVPAGFGFYMADFGEGGCSVATISSCALDPNSSFNALPGSRSTSATASFSFEVFSGETRLTGVDGTITLVSNGAEVGGWHPELVLNDPDHLLQDFTLATVPGSYNAFGYAWGENPLDVTLLSGVGLQTITYRTSVTASVSNACVIDGTGCLIAYSGFGDPIGRGGGDSFLALRGGPRFISSGQMLYDGGNGIDGLEFQEAHFRIPRVDDNGNIVLELVDLGPGTGPGVPEPTSWALMIGGFGLMGAALRRRRVSAYT